MYEKTTRMYEKSTYIWQRFCAWSIHSTLRRTADLYNERLNLCGGERFNDVFKVSHFEMEGAMRYKQLKNYADRHNIHVRRVRHLRPCPHVSGNFFSANIFLRMRKFPHPHAAYSNRFPESPSVMVRSFFEFMMPTVH